MELESYERVVVGAGIIGACAAYQLVKAGHRRVLLVDQFPLPHSRGSSHGHSRAIHVAYKDPREAQMARRSRALWDDIQRKNGETLVQDIPMLVVGYHSPEIKPDFDAYMSCLNEGDRSTIEGSDLSKALPVAEFSHNSIACVDNTAGILLADKCLSAVTRLFVSSGGHLRPSWAISEIVPRGDRVILRSPKGNIVTERLVVCAGAWSGPLLAPLGVNLKDLLVPMRIPVMYWKIKEGFIVQKTGIDIREKIYWLNSQEYPGLLKVCPHFGAPCDPDRREQTTVDKVMATVSDYLRKTFPGLESRPAVVETCMYTNTPDGRCIIDVHPLHSNIVIATGMSGTGFKMGPVFGEVIQRLVDGDRADFDVSIFSIQRFLKNKSLL